MLETADNPPVQCEHLCETTSRYDHAEKELSFLLLCAVCGTEQLIDRIRYEPRFTPPGTSASRTGVFGRSSVRFPYTKTSVPPR